MATVLTFNGSSQWNMVVMNLMLQQTGEAIEVRSFHA